MSKKDYEAIASILRSAREVVEERPTRARMLGLAPIDQIERDLIALFESESPRFDRDRFRSASRATSAFRKAITDQLGEAI
jgi:hypothetical protein